MAMPIPRKRRWSAPWLLLVLALLAGCGGGGGSSNVPDAGPTLGPADMADYYPLNTGDLWIYLNIYGAEERIRTLGPVGASEPGVWRVGNSRMPGVDSYYRRTATAVTFLGSRSSDPQDRALGDIEVFRLPARLGQSWVLFDKVLPKFADADGDGVADDVAARAVATTLAYEAVDTPTGRFERALKIRFENTQTVTFAANGRKFSDTVVTETWYVADLGPVRSVTVQVGPPLIERARNALAGYKIGSRRSKTTAPEIRGQGPVDGSYVQSGRVEVYFGEEMDPESAPQAVVVTGPDGVTLPGAVRWDRANQLLIYEPTGPVPQGRYNIALAASLSDLFGNTLAANTSWSAVFDNTAPALVSTNPAQGAVGVGIGTRIEVVFSEAVAAASMPSSLQLMVFSGASNGWPVDGKVSGAGTTWTFTPDRPLLRGARYELLISGRIYDPAVNFLPFSRVSFTTEPGRFDAVRWLADPADVRYLAPADMDGDGRADVVMLMTDGRLLLVQQRAGGVLEPRVIAATVPYGSARFVVADLNQDGRPDIVFDNGSAWLAQQADGSFLIQTLSSGQSLTDTHVIRMPDGLLAVAGLSRNQQRSIWRQRAPGVFAAPETLDIGGGYGGEWVVGDVDGDGLPDIVSVLGYTEDSFSLVIDYQQADGRFAARQVLPVTNKALLRSNETGASVLALADLDGDGRTDLVYTTIADAGFDIMFVRQTGPGVFAAPVRVATGAMAGLYVVDIDGDGRLDLLTGSTSSAVVIHFQQPSGQFADGELYGDGFAHGPFAVADFNGDGRTDIFARGLIWYQRAGASAARAQLRAFGMLQGRDWERVVDRFKATAVVRGQGAKNP